MWSHWVRFLVSGCRRLVIWDMILCYFTTIHEYFLGYAGSLFGWFVCFPSLLLLLTASPSYFLLYPLHSHSHLTHSFGCSDVPYLIILNPTPFPLLLASMLRFMPWDMGLCVVFLFLCSLLARILSFSTRTDTVETIARKSYSTFLFPYASLG